MCNMHALLSFSVESLHENSFGVFFKMFVISGVNVVGRWLEAEFVPLYPPVLLYNLATDQKCCIYLSQFTSEVVNIHVTVAALSITTLS